MTLTISKKWLVTQHQFNILIQSPLIGRGHNVTTIIDITQNAWWRIIVFCYDMLCLLNNCTRLTLSIPLFLFLFFYLWQEGEFFAIVCSFFYTQHLFVGTEKTFATQVKIKVCKSLWYDYNKLYISLTCLAQRFRKYWIKARHVKNPKKIL